MAKQLTLSDSLKAVKVQFDFYCECGVSPNSPYSLEDSDFSPIIGYTAGNAEVSRRTMVFAQSLYKDTFGKEYNPIIKDNTKKAGNPDNCMSYQQVKNLLK